MRKLSSWLLLSVALGGCTIADPPRTAEPAPSLPPALQGLGDVVGDARTVVFGEDSHGMLAVHELVPHMFRYLVEQRGFRVFLFEAQWGIEQGLADFMASDRTTLGPVESYWLNGAFASQPIGEMLVWIRDWNRAHPDDPILIAGYQPEQPVTDFRALFTHLSAIAPAEVPALRVAVAPCMAADAGDFPTELDFITRNSRLQREGRPSFTAEERAACLSGLDRIQAVLDRLEGDDRSEAAELARLQLHSLRTYFGLLRRVADYWTGSADRPLAEQVAMQGEAYHGGDAARFRIFQSLRRMRFPGRKMFLWMHNWHAFRHASQTGPLSAGEVGIPHGTVSFGERLAAAEGDDLVVIGNIVPCGSTCDEPPDSLETAFTGAFGPTPRLVDLRRPADADALPVASPGALYANHHRFGLGNVVLRHQVDAIVYLPESAVVR